MSFNAASAASIYGTPSRSERLPFPHSSQPSPAHTPQRQLATSAASTSSSTIPASSSSTPSVNKDRPVTTASLLKLYAGSADPKGAALEHSVTDRNVLCAQNAQLWKLIEKQRSGYNQILKELERVRAERDALKSKLGNPSSTGSNSGHGEKRYRPSGDRSAQRSFSDTSNTTNLQSPPSNGDPRQTMSRHHSDDLPTPRSAHHSLHPSRSHEPLSPRERDPTFQTNLSQYSSQNPVTSRPQTLPPPPSSAPSALGNSAIPQSHSNQGIRSQRHSPAPLIVPPRAENLPFPASAVSATQETNSYGRMQSSSPQDTSANANNGIANGDAILPHIRGSAYPRKSSLADSISSGFSTSTGHSINTTTSSNNFSHGSSSVATSPYTAPSHLSQYNGGLTPQTAPAGFGASSADSHQPLQRNATAPQIQSQPYPPQILVPTPTAAGPPQIVTPATASNGMLSTIPEGSHSQMLSRDSRISLPDEARQYIANMTDSPVPSPRADAFVARFTGARMVQPQVTIPESSGSLAPPAGIIGEADSPGGTSEFLDMGEEEEDDDDDDQESAITEPEAETEMDYEVVDTPSPQDGPQRQPPSEDSLHLQAQERKPKPRAAVEDFPLPPPGPHTSGQQLATQHAPQQPQMYTQTQHISSDLVSQQTPPSVYSSSDHLSSSENPHSPPGQYQPNPSTQSLRMEAEKPQQQPPIQSVPASFRELPLLSSDLPYTAITVSHSFVRPNDRGKEVLSFVVFVNPGHGKEGWKVEKMYSDVLGLDQRVRSSVGKGVGKKIANLPEGKLWKDHAPAKVDQRKAVLENYLQTLINLPVKNNNEVIAFFTSDILREAKQPVMQVGHKEGYLTKRGKNFGGWKTRYFVLQGPILEYYDCRGGAHLGSILVTGAQIGRQQRSERAPTTDEEKEYRHAFLIVEAKKGPGGNHPRHVLCAESDEDRDSWVEILVRYFSGTYSEEPVKYGPSPISINTAHQNAAQPRSSTSSHDSPSSRRPVRGLSKDDISISKGAAVPISQLPPDYSNTKLFQPAPVIVDNLNRSASPAKSVEPSPIDHQGVVGSNFDAQNINARRIMERGQGQPSSLPDPSPLSAASHFPIEPANNPLGQRANSELGHYPDLQDHRAGRTNRQVSPERHRTRDPHDGRKSFYPTLNTVTSSPTTASSVDRIPSPDKLDLNGKSKVISGPINGAPIPSGFKFGGKDAPSASESTAAERREKAKSRSFWGFGKANGDKANHPVVTYIPRAVFGVTLDEALDVAQIANLPAIVFRSIQYLEAKKADQEEGIYRLSGSSAVIKSLKDRFNMEGDVDLLASDEYWDPHAIAGLLKSFLRELPASILTRDLHLKFLAVIDFVDAQERIRELSQLIAALPIANYSLLRALTAHLILIVQNSSVNKMTMRNVGIVFSPTLGIPAGVFSLMLGEFNRVFNVDSEEASGSGGHGDGDGASDLHRRNSRQYSDAAADQLLGLAGRSLKTSAEETHSDGDDLSVQDESGTETTDGDFTVESSSESGPGFQQNERAIRVTPPDTPVASKISKASNVAASRGLNVSVTQSDRGNRHSRMMGLPTSPRPPHSPAQPDMPSPPTHSKE